MDYSIVVRCDEARRDAARKDPSTRKQLAYDIYTAWEHFIDSPLDPLDVTYGDDEAIEFESNAQVFLYAHICFKLRTWLYWFGDEPMLPWLCERSQLLMEFCDFITKLLRG